MSPEEKSAREGRRNAKQAHRDAVRTELQHRSLERRRAVEEFGTNRPRAIGALRERDRQRQMEAAGINIAQQQAFTQSVAALGKASEGKGLKDLDWSKPDTLMNVIGLVEMVKQNPALLPFLDTIPGGSELRAILEAQAAEAAKNPPTPEAKPAGGAQMRPKPPLTQEMFPADHHPFPGRGRP